MCLWSPVESNIRSLLAIFLVSTNSCGKDLVHDCMEGPIHLELHSLGAVMSSFKRGKCIHLWRRVKGIYKHTVPHASSLYCTCMVSSVDSDYRLEISDERNHWDIKALPKSVPDDNKLLHMWLMRTQTHLKTWTHCVRPHITQTHTYTNLLTHSAALTQLALMLWILALRCTWSPVGRDLAVIQLLTGPSCPVSAVSTLTQVENVTPSWLNHSEALLLSLRCCLEIHTFPFPPFSASCSKIELPFVCFDFF